MSQQSDPKREQTRADRVRARRQAEQERQNKSARPSQPKPQARPSANPQSSSSGNVFARPTGKQRQPLAGHLLPHQQNRETNELRKPSVNRRITIPLNKQGAEIEFSTLPVMNIGWRLASAVIAAGAIAAMIVMAFTMRVETPVIEGLSPSMAAEASIYLGLAGKPVFLIEPVEISERLQEGYPEVKSAKVEINFPNEVIVTADVRRPVYAWVLEDDERLFLIDDEGEIYPAEPDATTEGLVVIQASSLPDSKVEFEASEDILIEIIGYIDPYAEPTATPLPTFRGDSYTVDPSVMRALEQILLHIPDEAALIYDSRHGFGWNDEQGWDAYFGFELEQIDMKMAVYESIVNNITHQGVDASIISVEYLHAPYYRED